MKLSKQFIDDLTTLVSECGLPSELKLEDRTIVEFLCDSIITLSKVQSAKIKDNSDDNFIEYIYAMYPTKCPMRNTSLGKSHKDKDRIKKLLKMYTKEQIVSVVENEVSSKLGKQYMQNFSTFLNNFPDPNTLEDKDLFITMDIGKDDSKSVSSIMIGGQIYR